MNTHGLFPREAGPLRGPTAPKLQEKGDTGSVVPCPGVLGMDSVTAITSFACLWPHSALVRLAGSLQLSAWRGHCLQHSWSGRSSSVYIPARLRAGLARGRRNLSRFDWQAFLHSSSSPVSSLFPSYCILRDLLGVFQRRN